MGGADDARATTNAREIRRLLTTLAAFSLPLAVALAAPDVAGLSPWGLRVLAVVAAGLVLWLTETVPLAVSSVAIVVLLALVAPGASDAALRSALAGFQTSAPYFMLGALSLGAATVRTGLARRLARLIVRGARGSGRRLYWQMIALMPLMAIMVPSAVTRSAMLIPAYEAVLRAHRLERGHRLPRLIMLATATLQMQVSTAVLTGGSVPILAASLLGGLSWARWFALMSVPNYAILFGMAGILALLYRPAPLPVTTAVAPAPDEAALPERMTPPEWRALVIIGATTLLWLTDGIHHLDPTIPALLGSLALFLPAVGVLTWDDFEASSPWAIFLTTGASLSLAAALTDSGAAAWLATSTVDAIPFAEMSLVPQLLVIITLVGVVNVILPNRNAVLGITIPLVVSLAASLGLNPLAVGLIVPIVAQTTIYYPVQIATAMVTFRTRHYAAGELFRAGVLLTLVAVAVIYVVALPWWALLGEPVR